MSLALEIRSSSRNAHHSTNTGRGTVVGRYKIQHSSGIISAAPFVAAMLGGGSSNSSVGMFAQALAAGKKGVDSDSCSSSSSIGRNSDLSINLTEGGDSGENEAQSDLKGPLQTMDALEDVLPVKKGLSSFYSGKSKSFTRLDDVSKISSVKELAKPKNSCSCKRKNLLASSRYWDKKHQNTVEADNCGAFKRRRSFLSGGCGNSSGSRGTFRHCLSQHLPPLHSCGVVKGSVSSTPPQRVVVGSPPCRSLGVGCPPCRSLSLSDQQSNTPASESGHDGTDESDKTNL